MIDQSTGFVSGGASNAQTNVMKTTNGGPSWTEIPSVAQGEFQLGLAATSASTALVSGVSMLDGACLFLTDNGRRFTNSSMPDVSLQQSQDAQAVRGCNDGNRTFAAVGSFQFYSSPAVNGYALSTDAAASFTTYVNMSEIDPDAFSARYGAFPACDTAFISTGTWPDSAQTAAGSFKLSSKVHVSNKGLTLNRVRRHRHHTHGHQSSRNVKSGGWSGSIALTTDGGRTFKNVFTSDSFYFNQIVCPSVKVCFAVAENDDYGFVYGTQNGGDSWNELLRVSGTSLMAVDALSNTDVFVAGGVLAQSGINGTIFSSNDGGKTFEQTNLPGYYLTNIKMTSLSSGIATATDEDNQSDILYLK